MPKNDIVDEILKNSVYMPNSGIIQSLRKALVRIGVTNLENLKLIIDLKIEDAKPSEDTK